MTHFENQCYDIKHNVTFKLLVIRPHFKLSNILLLYHVEFARPDHE